MKTQLIEKRHELAIRITSKAKNDILAAFVEASGGLRKASRRIGVCVATLADWVNFRSAPSAHSMRMKPDKYAKVIVAIERETGRNLEDIFPAISRIAKKILAEPRTAKHVIDVVNLENTIARQALSYQAEFSSLLDAPEIMDRAISRLSDRQQKVIRLRFGIGQPNGKQYTLQEVAKVMRITAGGVSAIEHKALQKLREPGTASIVVGLLD